MLFACLLFVCFFMAELFNVIRDFPLCFELFSMFEGSLWEVFIDFLDLFVFEFFDTTDFFPLVDRENTVEPPLSLSSFSSSSSSSSSSISILISISAAEYN